MPKYLRDHDRGLRKLIATVKGLPNSTVEVGVFDGAMAELASYHEFGTERIPARPFIGGWCDENGALIDATLKRAATAAMAGKFTPDIALIKAGLFFAGGMQKRIAAGIAPPNAPSTIASKGSSVPLIDTGHLRSSITAKVRG